MKGRPNLSAMATGIFRRALLPSALSSPGAGDAQTRDPKISDLRARSADHWRRGRNKTACGASSTFFITRTIFQVRPSVPCGSAGARRIHQHDIGAAVARFGQNIEGEDPPHPRQRATRPGTGRSPQTFNCSMRRRGTCRLPPASRIFFGAQALRQFAMVVVLPGR